MATSRSKKRKLASIVDDSEFDSHSMHLDPQANLPSMSNLVSERSSILPVETSVPIRSNLSAPTAGPSPSTTSQSGMPVDLAPHTASPRFVHGPDESDGLPPADTVDPAPDSGLLNMKVSILQEFSAHLSEFGQLLLDQEYHPDVGHICSCSTDADPHSNAPSCRRRFVKCFDCSQYEISCDRCFLESHVNLPFHWAQVWNADKGFFERKDHIALPIAVSEKRNITFQLSHNGRRCPNLPTDKPRAFSVIHTNGVHNLRLQFCGCPGRASERAQLMNARLFPATLERPSTAFTFSLLKEFHLHNLESKCSAYDYIRAIMRLTNNKITHLLADKYQLFIRTVRVWRLLVAQKRAGHFHNINPHVAHRPVNSLVVYCPVCPDPYMNMDKGWEDVPTTLRHLTQVMITIDGNFQCNKQKKNGHDDEDVSLFGGRAQFPEESRFQRYLSGASPTDEKSTCNYLNVVNKQNSKKFKNMDITGVVNIQCPHVFVVSTVDLQLGERFANVDYALYHANQVRFGGEESRKNDISRLHHFASYDCGCQYSVKFLDRIKNNAYFNRFAFLVPYFKWLIPALHIQNHKDDCMYRYAAAYTEHSGRFHGESAEQFWPELNQLGPTVRQMNNGHRQDTVIDHSNDWNYKKEMKIIDMLIDELMRALKEYEKRRESFRQLTAVHAVHVSGWKQKFPDRTYRLEGGKVISPYSHSEQTVPSQKAMYEKLIADESLAGPSSLRQMLADSESAHSATIIFLNEGIEIGTQQLKLKYKAQDDQLTESRAISLENQCESLSSRIAEWRKVQKKVMPEVGDLLQASVKITDACGDSEVNVMKVVVNEKLFLPSEVFSIKSDSNASDSENIRQLGAQEAILRKGQAYDAVMQTCNIVKVLSAATKTSRKQDRGQDANTRSTQHRNTLKRRRDNYIRIYNNARRAMILLGALTEQDSSLPPLSVDDTFRKDTTLKRQLGDSKQPDGPLWAIGTRPSSTLLESDSVTKISTTAQPGLGMAKSRARRQPDDEISGPIVTSNATASGSNVLQDPEHRNGWIWSISVRGDPKENEKVLKEWFAEEDRVQWFRAEAEYHRWLEQYEIKQAELLRARSFFRHMSVIWAALAEDHHPSATTGRACYAKKQSSIYSDRYEYAQKKIQGLKFIKTDSEGSLVPGMLERRANDDKELRKILETELGGDSGLE